MEENEELQLYLEGELSEAQRLAFEQRIAADPDLEERVHLHQRLEAHGFADPVEQSIEAELRVLMEDRQEQEGDEVLEDERSEAQGKKRRSPFGTIWLVAAGIALLAAVSFFLFRPGSPVSHEELFAMQYAPYDASKELRTDANIPTDLLEPAFAHYDKGDYQSAREAFEQILLKYPSHPRATFYLGLCQLETGSLAEARASFQFVHDHGKNLYLSQSAWYLGLVCLKTNDKACVVKNLEPLTRKDNAYREGAEYILEEYGP